MPARGSLNYTVYRKCCNEQCSSLIDIRIDGDPSSTNFGNPIIKHRTRKFCSVSCQNMWQDTRTWEDIHGVEKASTLRETKSKSMTMNNISTNPDVAKKISASMKKFIENNSHMRMGVNNGFYGKNHSTDQKRKWHEDKKGKMSYSEDQRKLQLQNTPKKENHPNWNSGSSCHEYGPEFTKTLKTEIKQKYNHTCQLCEISDIELDVHHIDYNKRNNDPSNLIPLCKICHGKTNYNRDAWQILFESRRITTT